MGDNDLIVIENNKVAQSGKNVMDHLFELIKTTDMSHEAIAGRLNEIYNLELVAKDVTDFFEGNLEIIENKSVSSHDLNKIRANLHLDHNEHLVKDIKNLDKEITLIQDDDLLESDKRGKIIGDLVDKKGRLLLRQARLTGKLDDSTKKAQIGKVENMQVNIYESEKESELLRDLKKANFKEKIINVTPGKIDEKKK